MIRRCWCSSRIKSLHTTNFPDAIAGESIAIALRYLIGRVLRTIRDELWPFTMQKVGDSVIERRDRLQRETVNVSMGRSYSLVNRNLGSENPQRKNNTKRGDSGNIVQTGATCCGIMRNYICIWARVHSRLYNYRGMLFHGGYRCDKCTNISLRLTS